MPASPEGPLVSKSNLCLAAWYQNKFYVLSDTSGSSSYSYTFLEAVVVGVSSVKIKSSADDKFALFEIDGNSDGSGKVYLREKRPDYNSGYLSYSQSGGTWTAVKSETKTEILLSQSTYQTWGGTTLALAGIPYSFNTPAGSTLSFHIEGIDSPVHIRPFMIPSHFYFDCNATVCSEVKESMNEGILAAYCSTSTSDVTSKCAGVIGDAWTDLKDAGIGVFYEYCTTGEHCNSDCKSPCSTDGNVCKWDSSEDEFVCTPGGILPNHQFWTRTWFIVLMIVLAILVVIGLIVLFAYISRKRKSEEMPFQSPKMQL